MDGQINNQIQQIEDRLAQKYFKRGDDSLNPIEHGHILDVNSMQAESKLKYG